MRRPLSTRDVLKGSAALAAGTVFASPARAAQAEGNYVTEESAMRGCFGCEP
ncbi:hypothetical protein [Bradyrhizobium sp. USDA 4451]